MQKDPVLAVKTIPAVRGSWPRVALTFRVEGGLHYIRGNAVPYFSLTYASHRKGFPNQCYSGGAGHDEILKHFPRFADLAALHLSDIDGVPMHAASNGWYNLAGYFNGAGERYHGGNSERHFRIEPPADKPWKNTEYRKPTREECLKIWAEHVRIPLAEAQEAAEAIGAVWNWPDMKVRHAAFIEAQKPRWKAEAEACIAKHGLVVYGDPWPVAA